MRSVVCGVLSLSLSLSLSVCVCVFVCVCLTSHYASLAEGVPFDVAEVRGSFFLLSEAAHLTL